MMRKLTRFRDEATRLYTTLEEHKDSNDAYVRRKVHVDVDRFLMENREAAMLLIIHGINAEIRELKTVPKPWYRRIMKGRLKHVKS